MYWRVAGLPSTSPVDELLDKDVYSLEELLDEDEIIQECKSQNTRLINYLRGKAQVQQMLRYIIEDPPEGAENRRAFKFPFIACEIFTCEIDAIFKSLGEDEELMNMLFSFLDPSGPHGTLLAGYFSKVVSSLLQRKTILVMQYLHAHQEILKKMVDLIGVTSIMEVLVRLVGADEHISTSPYGALQWLADTDLLEMLVDKLSPPNSSEVHANAAETLSAVTRIASSALASKLASPKFVGKLFNHVLEDPKSKSTLVHSLSVCISLLDPKRAATVAAARGQHATEPLPTANPETVDGMLQRLGDLLKLLDVTTDHKVLPTTYGQLRPPLGIYRLKIVEFIAVLLRTNSEVARQELIRLGAIQMCLNLIFQYEFNNMLHHHVENIITSCIESNSQALIDHLFKNCNFIARLLAANDNPYAPDTRPEPRIPANKVPSRIGSMGHLTRIANKIVHAATTNPLIQGYLQANPRWSEWQNSALQSRNMLENVLQWTCGRPTSRRDRPVDSDDEELRERDFDISTMASNMTREVYRYDMFDNEDIEEGHGGQRDDEEVYFDDESAEVVISSLRLDEQESGRTREIMFDDRNWFAFQEDARSHQPLPTYLISPPSPRVDNEQVANAVSPSNSSGDSSSDDEVVVGDDEDLVDTASSPNGFGGWKGTGEDTSNTRQTKLNSLEDLSKALENFGLSDADKLFLFNHGERISKSIADWEPSGGEMSSQGTSGREMFVEKNPFETCTGHEDQPLAADNIMESLQGAGYEAVDEPGLKTEDNHDTAGEAFTPLFGGLPLVGVEPEGTVMAMEKALKEGIVGEAGPILPSVQAVEPDMDPRPKDLIGNPNFNDVNYWRSDYDQSLGEEENL